MARQWTSRQTPGRRCRLAAISIRKIAGTTVAVGMASEIAVIASSEKPNPGEAAHDRGGEDAGDGVGDAALTAPPRQRS